jgi:hypothetical protein
MHKYFTKQAAGAALLLLTCLTDNTYGQTCRESQIGLADDCDSISQRCGVPKDDIAKFNPQIALCNLTLIPSGLLVCCSSGELQVLQPQNNDDGECAMYVTSDNETSTDIANTFELPFSFIEKLNNETCYGWPGCDHLTGNQVMCLSIGTALDNSRTPEEDAIIPNNCGESPYGTLDDINGAMDGNSVKQGCLNQYMIEVLQRTSRDHLIGTTTSWLMMMTTSSIPSPMQWSRVRRSK